MAKYKGRLFLLQVEDTPGLGTFSTIGALSNVSTTFNQEEVDITDKGSAPWKELLADAGIRSFAISADGFYSDDSVFQILYTAALNGVILNYRIISEAGDQFEGAFNIASTERSGGTSDAEAFTISLSSSGTIAYTAAP